MDIVNTVLSCSWIAFKLLAGIYAGVYTFMYLVTKYDSYEVPDDYGND